MATDLLKRDPVTGLPVSGAPAGFPLVGTPAPLPMLTAGTPPIPQTAQVRANAFGDAAAVAANPAVQPVAAPAIAGVNPNGAAFGIYPRPSSQFSTNANDAALQRGVQAIGPGQFAPAVQPSPTRMDNITDPRSTQFGMVPGAVAPAAVPAAAAAPAVAGMPAQPAIDPVTGAPARTMDNGNVSSNYDGTGPAAAGSGNVATISPADDARLNGRPNALGSLADTRAQLADLQASNAAVQRGGLSVIDNGGADRNAAFNEGAALRTAAAQGSWSPRRGFQGNEAAVSAALAPINNRARSTDTAAVIAGQAATTAAREAGDTTRLGMREAGDTTRAAITGGRDQQRLDLERQGFGLKAQAAVLDNAARQRMEVVQQEIQNAKTPEERRAGAEKLAALSGKERPNRYKAIEVGGGSTIDPATGVAVPQPKSVVVYDEATGQTQTSTPGAAAAAKPAVAEGSMSTANGKPIKFTGGKWVPA